MSAAQEQRVYAAIADPTRRRIITMLAKEPHAVRDLAHHFDVSRPAISKHLRVLKQANLVVEEKVGRQRFYATNRDPLQGVQNWLDSFWASRLQALKSLVE